MTLEDLRPGFGIPSDPKDYIDSEREYSAVLLDMFCAASSRTTLELTSIYLVRSCLEARLMAKKYTCTVCGYVYDPEKGDPDSGIDPGTAFEDLPDDWTCPECGAPKDAFEAS